MILSDPQYERLKVHLGPLLARTEEDRKKRSAYYDTIFQVLHGDVDYTKSTKKERQRAKAAENGQINAVPDDLMRFGEGALRELTNSVVAIMMPVDTPYAAVAAPGQQDNVDALISICRSMAAQQGHRSAITKMTYHWLATQDTFAHLHYHRVEDRQPEAGAPGLEIQVPSLYSAFWDNHLPLCKVAADGEIMGFHEKASLTQLYMQSKRIGSDYTIPSVDDHERRVALMEKPYKIRPTYRDKNGQQQFSMGEADGGQLSYEQARGAFKDLTQLAGRQAGLIRTIFYVRLPPEILQIDTVQEMRIYRLELLDGHLVHIEDFASGFSTMPCVACNLYGTADCDEYRSYGEHAAALTKMLSAITNLTKQGMRREAAGPVVIYDSRLFDADYSFNDAMKDGVNAVKANVKALANGEAKLRDYVFTVDPGSAPSRTAEADGLASMFNSYLFPKSAKGDLVNLDRATAFHAALAAGTADISLLSIATLGDDGMMEPLRRLLKYAILNNVSSLRVVDRKKQVILNMNAGTLAEMQFELLPSQPIAGFDRHRTLLTIERALAAAQQIPEAQQIPGFMMALLRSFIETGSSGTLDLDHFLEVAQRAQANQPQPTQPIGDTSAPTIPTAV